MKIESSKEKELLFLKYAATDIPYKDIANKMLLSRHTIDDYRNSLYEKFAVKSRIGLVLLAFGAAFKSGVVLSRENESFI